MSTAHSTPSSAELSPWGRHKSEGAPRPRPSASRRRDKPQLSCNFCRRRKSRCNRQQPCATCVSRGQACVYSESIASTTTLERPGTAATSLQDRLMQLERLVTSLMAKSADKPNVGPTPPSSSISQVDVAHLDTPVDERSECGSMQVSASELHYVGGDHWAAILDSIADLKDHADREEHLRLISSPERTAGDDGEEKSNSYHALLLYGCRRASSRCEILSALPPKAAVDRYISRYFNRLDLVSSSAVHGPSFLKEYEAFWNNQSSTPIMWVGLLFGMICLAVIASDASESTNSNDACDQLLLIELYREKTVQCLLMGEYTKPGPYTLETFIHYLYVEFAITQDAGKDTWFLLALQVNLAMRMGYHRDPSHFPGISPLQGEMRRRLWTTVVLGDILISSQMGMPRMTSDSQCDTAEPRNLNDTDLDEHTSELPASRPETENTTTLGVIAQRRVLLALGQIQDLTASVRNPSYSEVMRVDGILGEAIAKIPPALKMKPLTASVTDTPQVIMSRLFLQHMLYKGQIMLHRRFLFLESPSADEDLYAYSRDACLEASLGTLKIQHILDDETCPGGQLYSMRWRVTSSMNHGFLTATMILCSLLYRNQTLGRKEKILTALRRSRTIWIRRSSSSREAKKAAEAVSAMLAKTGEGRSYDWQPKNSEHGEDEHSSGCGAISTHPESAWNGSGTMVGSDAQNMLGDSMDVYDPDQFLIPGIMGTCTPLYQQWQDCIFNNSIDEDSGVFKEWMLSE